MATTEIRTIKSKKKKITVRVTTIMLRRYLFSGAQGSEVLSGEGHRVREQAHEDPTSGHTSYLDVEVHFVGDLIEGERERQKSRYIKSVTYLCIGLIAYWRKCTAAARIPSTGVVSGDGSKLIFEELKVKPT